jgi:mono/diheme cytochrome c family protein
MRRLLLSMFAVGLFLGSGPAWASDSFAGKKVYDLRCVGCHGPQGIPMFPGTPSFARGERLQAPDTALMATIKAGKNLCPSWRRIVPDADLMNVLSYIRTLHRY